MAVENEDVAVEKIEKRDYFTNPEKDMKKRPGRPPGSKNKKTLQKEAEVEQKKVKKYIRGDKQSLDVLKEALIETHDQLDRVYDTIYNASTSYFDTTETHGRFDGVFHSIKDAQNGIVEQFQSMEVLEKSETKKWIAGHDANNIAGKPIYEREELSNAIEKFCYFLEDQINMENYGLRDIYRELRALQEQLDYLNGHGDMWKSVTFKGYDGTWNAIAKAGHYTMWQSVEMGDKAYNIITKTKKNVSTGKLVEKIVMEDVDGFEDAKVQKMFGVKKEKVGIPMDNLSQVFDKTLREFAERYGIDTNEDNWKKKVFERMVEEDGYDPSTIDQHLGYYDLSQKE